MIDPEIIPRLRSDVAQCLVGFELVFPPTFFNIMTHVLVHLVDEIVILGPVFLHNMFPFERFMGVLKKYVKIISKCMKNNKPKIKNYATYWATTA